MLRFSFGQVLSCIFHWPSSVSLGWAATQVQAVSAWHHLAEVLLFDLLLRVARLVFLVAHELTHIVVALGLFQASSQHRAAFHSFCCYIDIGDDAGSFRESKQPWRRLFKHLVPGIRARGLHVQLPTAGLVCWQEEVIRCSGVAFSVTMPALVLAMITFNSTQPAIPPWQAAIFLGAFSAAAGALLSDLPGGPIFGSGNSGRVPPGVFCCGNWGCLVPRECLDSSSKDEFFPRVLEQLLSNVLNVVELRGAQAGGCATFLRGNRGQVVCARSRTVKSKRGRLAPMLFGKFRRQMSLQSCSLNPFTCFRQLRLLPVVLAQGHSRFGTSSVPAENETHPHQWLGNHRDRFWRQEAGKNSWKLEESADVTITITHNGDFDGWRVFDEVIPNGELGEWISRILHKRNTAKGDSPKLAGVFDILLVQGRWTASVRLAFIRSALKHVDEICDWEELGPDSPNVAPRPEVFRAWAKPFEEIFAQVSNDFTPTEAAVKKLASDVSKRIQKDDFQMGDADAHEALQRYVILPGLIYKFCRDACKFFFSNDLMSSVWEFFRRAEGTFGISVSCSLWPETIVLAAKGQPISLAFDSERPLVYWASEPVSLAQLWPGGSGTPAGRVRLDMMDDTGEALELRLVSGRTAMDHASELNVHHLDGTLLSHSNYFPLPALHDDDEERPFHVMIRGIVFNSSEPVPLTRTRFQRRCVLLSMADKMSQNSACGDVVAKDISNIPRVLAEIDDCWQDRNSLNRVSAVTFANCIGALLKDRKKAGPDIDVLIFGIENSLWLGQQFAADLARIFPCLNVVAMSSNWVLGMLQSCEGHVEPLNWTMTRRKFQLSQGGIALGISQSGTTYPTVWASRLLRALVSRPEIFAAAGQFDTVMANSLAGGATFSGKLFSSLCGIRPAEPSTLATIAMHHTLTKLVLFCAEHLLLSGQIPQRVNLEYDSVLLPGSGSRPSCELRLPEIQDLKQLSCTLTGTSEEIVGVTQHGIRLPTEIHKDLIQTGRYLSSHLQEVYWSTFMSALYVIITVTVGFPIVGGSWSLVVESIKESWVESDWFLVGKYVTSFLDSIIYCCLAAICATVHRFFTGRRLWTRYTARTVVIVDSTANYKLLRAYLSKLRALAWRWTAFGVAGQNGQDHFVHEMTHLAHSDVLLAVGRTDGRLSSLAASESSLLMSVQQARYIAGKKSGSVEAIGIGHNPWRKEGLFARTVVLPTKQRPLFLSERELNTDNGEHAPGNVMHKIAGFVSMQRLQGKEAVPWSGKKELMQRVGGQQNMSHEKAQEVVSDIIHEQSEQLSINPDHFDSARFFKKPEISSPRLQTTSAKNQPRKSSDTVSIAQIMAVLRGRDMQEHIAELQERQRKATTMKDLITRLVGRPDNDLLTDVFSGWVTAVRALVSRRENAVKSMAKNLGGGRRTSQGGGRRVSTKRVSTIGGRVSVAAGEVEVADCPEWRKNEEIRRFARSRYSSMFGLSLRSVFESWKDTTAVERAKAGRQRPHKKGSCIIGGGLAGKVSHKQLLAEIGLLEGLYESRMAAAESLLELFVLFHEAVRPIASLPFLGYDMDRSESRLRVASTPAPIGFVEKLPEGSNRVQHAVTVLQNAWIRHRYRQAQKEEKEASEDGLSDGSSEQPKADVEEHQEELVEEFLEQLVEDKVEPLPELSPEEQLVDSFLQEHQDSDPELREPAHPFSVVPSSL